MISDTSSPLVGQTVVQHGATFIVLPFAGHLYPLVVVPSLWGGLRCYIKDGYLNETQSS